MAHESTLKLSPSIIGPADVARVSRELESVSDALHQASLREHKAASQAPAISRLLTELFAINDLEILTASDRELASDFLEQIKAGSPVITMSFAVDPSIEFIAKIIVWLRQNIHPSLLLRTGLQPNIAAGCVVRTSSHYYDCSLRSRFAAQSPQLLTRLQSIARKASE